jgi:hypothetical protein
VSLQEEVLQGFSFVVFSLGFDPQPIHSKVRLEKLPNCQS